LGFDWVAKAYNRGDKDDAGLENEMARLLLLRAEESDGRWVGVRSWLNDTAIGSILLVAKSGNREIEGDVVRGICDLIQDIVVPLMTEERALRSGGRKEIC
jgi:hypothetical protein